MTGDVHQEGTKIVRGLNLIGEQFAGYKVISELGRGGMAIVYKADELSLNRIVALKVLSPKISDDDTMIKRFEREAQAAAKLSHPNIVHIYSIGEEDGVNYFTMEYIKGKTLKEMRQEKGAMAPDEAVVLVTQAADALSEAHKAGLVHRDIKPSNIIVDSAGRAKIADFGIAHMAQATAQLTMDGQFLGTPQYMSPEQCEGKPVDGRSDIYSLGVTFYEMLTGRSPYDADTPASILVKISRGELKPIQDAVPTMPKNICDIVEKMLRTDAEDRFQDAAELVEALKAVSGTTQISSVEDRAAATTSALSRGPGIAIAAALVLLAAGLVALIYIRSKPDASPGSTAEDATERTEEESARVEVADAAESGPWPAAPSAAPTEGVGPSVPDEATPPTAAIVTRLESPTATVASPTKRSPPPNSVVVTTIGDEEKQGLITSYAQSALAGLKYNVIDGSSLGDNKIADVAKYKLVVNISKLGSMPLRYMGRESEMHTVALSMKMVSTETGSIVTGPVSETVKYTAINAQERLQEAVDKLSNKLKAYRE
jgi:serine/threonine protein kinase